MPISPENMIAISSKSIVSNSRSDFINTESIINSFDAVLRVHGLAFENDDLKNQCFSRYIKLILNASKNKYLTQSYVRDIIHQLLETAKH